ncbi:MAG: hypothetical protein SGI88_16060, partial [Candidatus Hydrogenedentes bacterium]|nr:hypothetical protein [Candidatus Hydrogenedentota bacterium]
MQSFQPSFHFAEGHEIAFAGGGFDAGFVGRTGFFDAVEKFVAFSEVEVCDGIVLLNLSGAVEVGERVFVFVEVDIGHAGTERGERVIGVELEHFC